MTQIRPKQLAQEGAADADVLTWDDTAGEWAPASPTGGGYTDEQVRDVVAAALVAGSNVTITPNDGADTITIAATGGGGGADATRLCTPQGTVDRQYTFDSTVEGFTSSAGGTTLSAVGGKLRLSGGVGINAFVLEPSGAAAVAHGEVWCDVRGVTADSAPGNPIGLLFRHADANNFYWCNIQLLGNPGSASACTVEWQKTVAGSTTGIRTVTQTVPYPDLVDARLMVRFVDDVFKLYMDETLISVCRDSSLTAGGICGLRHTATGSTNVIDVDNFTVTSLSSGWSPASY